MHDTFRNLCVCISLSEGAAGAGAGAAGGAGVSPKVSHAQVSEARKSSSTPSPLQKKA